VSKKVIRIYARGGLGNQLFQFAAAYHLAHTYNLKIEVDDVLVSSQARFNKGLGKRQLELDGFDSQLIILRNNSTLRSEFKSRMLWIARLLGDKFPDLMLRFGTFANEFEDQLATFKRIESAATINSYCSTPDYFPDCGNEIAQRISEVNEPSDWYLKWSTEISATKPMGINIRLGDYKNLTHIYGTVDPEYYWRSVQLLKELVGDRPIWVFSDEPELAAELLREKFGQLKFVEHSNDPRPIEYLNLLAKCEGIVCANSSFSWWAAFVATQLNPSSRVVFPRPMFNSNEIREPFNWLPSDWFTLGRNLEI
jgi:hypothetical protein